jgi:acyl dehydratase
MQAANRRRARRRAARAPDAGPGEGGGDEAERALPVGSRVTVEVAPRPLPALYVRGLALALHRRQGRLAAECPILPGLVVEQHGVQVGHERIAAWQAVCGDAGTPEQIPLCLPEALFLSPMGRLVTDPSFPLSPLGLIHVGQRIALHHALLPDERLDLRCRIAGARLGPRGVEMDVAMEVESGGVIKWEGTATMLSRASGVGGRRSAEPSARAWEHVVEVDIPEDTGRRYARVSGDWNPHHLWRATARLIGFARPIAHGMWTLARMIGVMGVGVPPGRPVLIDARFKRPILMPARAHFAWRGAVDHEDGIGFEVRGAGTGEVHLVGQVR